MIPAIVYRDRKAAMDWLARAFGFETFMLLENEGGEVVHYEMRLGDCVIMVGSEWSEIYRSPVNLEGHCTQALHIHIDEDVDAHCARARGAGAEVIAEPETQFYGDRVYRCRDPEGHISTVGQTVKAVSREEAEAETGLSSLRPCCPDRANCHLIASAPRKTLPGAIFLTRYWQEIRIIS